MELSAAYGLITLSTNKYLNNKLNCEQESSKVYEDESKVLETGKNISNFETFKYDRQLNTTTLMETQLETPQMRNYKSDIQNIIFDMLNSFKYECDTTETTEPEDQLDFVSEMSTDTPTKTDLVHDDDLQPKKSLNKCFMECSNSENEILPRASDIIATIAEEDLLELIPDMPRILDSPKGIKNLSSLDVDIPNMYMSEPGTSDSSTELTNALDSEQDTLYNESEFMETINSEELLQLIPEISNMLKPPSQITNLLFDTDVEVPNISTCDKSIPPTSEFQTCISHSSPMEQETLRDETDPLESIDLDDLLELIPEISNALNSPRKLANLLFNTDENTPNLSDNNTDSG